MTINYKGISKDFEYRLAEITFDDENEKERTLFDRLSFWLEKVQGYKVIESISGYATIQVEDYDEYKMVVKDYKDGKKMIKNAMKYNF